VCTRTLLRARHLLRQNRQIVNVRFALKEFQRSGEKSNTRAARERFFLDKRLLVAYHKQWVLTRQRQHPAGVFVFAWKVISPEWAL
jgi:hypothetical protein